MGAYVVDYCWVYDNNRMCYDVSLYKFCYWTVKSFIIPFNPNYSKDNQKDSYNGCPNSLNINNLTDALPVNPHSSPF